MLHGTLAGSAFLPLTASTNTDPTMAFTNMEAWNVARYGVRAVVVVESVSVHAKLGPVLTDEIVEAVPALRTTLGTAQPVGPLPHKGRKVLDFVGDGLPGFPMHICLAQFLELGVPRDVLDERSLPAKG